MTYFNPKHYKTMKNLFKTMMLVAVAAMGFTACSNDTTADVAPEMEQKKVTMTITAENTRTYLDANGKAQWSGTDEVITVYQLIDDAGDASFVDSSECVITEGKANFSVAFDEATGTSYKYSAIYPACNGVDTDGKESLTYVKLSTPIIQKPTTTSFDSNADLMIAKVIEKTEQPTVLSMQFTRVIAIAKMSLINMPTNDKLRNVTFEATGKILGGRSAFDVTKGAVVDYGYNSPSDMITLDYAENPIANNNAIYFTCLPIELAAGDTFTVTATTVNNVKYTRTVTLEGLKELKFTAGNMSTFSVNMKDAEEENLASLAGEYAVVALAGGKLQLMGNVTTTGTKYLTRTEGDSATEIPALIALEDNSSFIWIVEEGSKSGEYYLKQKSTNKYVFWGSGNSANLQAEPYALIITEGDNDSVNIISYDDNTRKLVYNSGSPRFAFYTSAQTPIYLVPIGVDTREKLGTPNVNAEADGKTVTVTWDDVENAGSYTLTYGDTTIENAASPYVFEGAYSTPYNFSVVAVPKDTDTETYKKSDAGTAEITTGADPNAGGDEATWHTESWSNFSGGTAYVDGSVEGDLGTWAYVQCSAYELTETKLPGYITMSNSNKNAKITSPTFANGVNGIKFYYYVNNTARKFKVIVYEGGNAIKTETITPSKKTTEIEYTIDVATTGSTYFTFEPTTTSNRVSIGKVSVNY